MFKKISAHARHGLAVILLGIGVIWSCLSFIANLAFSDGAPVSALWLNGIFSTGGDHQVLALPHTIRQWINEGLPYCSFLYLTILVFLFVRYCRNYMVCRRLRISGLSRIQPELRVFAESTSRLMGINKEVRIWLSTLVDGPLTLGFLRPVILIPFAMVNHLTMSQVEAIILHELAHIRRNDYLLNLGIAAVEVLFFFNPFTRLLIRDMKREREHCCDDLVLQFRYEPRTYASALLSLASKRQGKPQQLALPAIGANDRLLLQRVRRIIDQPGPSDLPGMRSILFFFFALATAIIIFFRSTPAMDPHAPLIVRHAPPAITPAAPATTPATTGIQLAELAVRTGHLPFTDQSAWVTLPSAVGQPVRIHFASVIVRSEIRIVANRRLTGHAPALALPAHPATRHKKEGPHRGPMPADYGFEPDDAIAVSDNYGSDAATTSPGELAVVAEVDNRAYSIGPNVAAPPIPPGAPNEQHQPYVPNSSFVFRFNTDTLQPGMKLLYAQQTAAREVEMAIRKMQRELLQQLQMIQTTTLRTALSEDQQKARKIQKQILLEQLKLQQEYLQKQLELEKKLRRTGRRVTIVYI